MASENFSLEHPSAGCLRGVRESVLTALLCHFSWAPVAPVMPKTPQTSRRNHAQRSFTELPAWAMQAPAGPDVLPGGRQGPRGFGERAALVGGEQAPDAPPRHLGTLGPSQPALARGCWLRAQLAEGVGKLSLQRARQYFRPAGYHNHSATDKT